MNELKILTLNIKSLSKKFRQAIILIKKYNPDFLFLQETYIDTERKANDLKTKIGLPEGYFSLGPFGSGVALFNCTDKWKITNINRDTQGRTIIATIQNKIQNNALTLINSYAPATKQFQQKYFETLTQTIHAFHSQHPIILAGDFNNTKDRDRHRNYYKALESLLETNNLTDAYEQANPTKIDTTHTSAITNTSHRLDRVYTHKDLHIGQVQHIEETLKFTDHKGVIAHIGIRTTPQPTRKKRSPHWKFNNTLLENKMYTSHIRKLIQTHLEDLEIEEQREQVSQLWELLKQNIILQTQTIATHLHRQKQKQYKEILEAISIAKQEGLTAQTHMLEKEAETFLDQQYKGAQIRTKLYNNTNETPDKQFLSLEQNVQRNRQIKEIKDADGHTHTDPHKISDSFKKFYKNLYTQEETCPTTQDRFLQYAKPLNDTDRTDLETPFTLDDLKNALSQMKLNKTPGPDGLTTEFYQHFFPDLGPILLKMIHEAHKKQTLPDSLSRSYITLIPKDNPDKTQMKNYRPISLLNVDYKIISKTITNKLQPYMSKLIHADQQCSIIGRKIQNHLHFIRDIITYTQEKQMQAAIISLDQEKAFDRVSHDYLFKTITAHNLGTYIETWIKTLYRNPQSQLLVNHTLSDPFTLTRSIRQGCSLSPLLYILTLEPLLENIRQNTTGINIPGNDRAKLLAYADDTTFLVSSNNEIIKIMDIFHLFGKGSGSKLNVSKTVAMGLGKWKNKADYPFGIEGKNEIKIYGLTFTNTDNQTPRKTWEDILAQTKSSLAYYKRLDTTIFGRAYIVNTTILSRLIYPCTILKIPDTFLKQINTEITNYIFQGTLRNIKKTTLALPKKEGGIGLQHITSKITALRIGYITDILTDRDKHPLAHYYLGLKLIRYIHLQNDRPHHFGRNNPTFYKTCTKIIQDHPHIIGKNTKAAYTEIINTTATPLHLRLKTAYKYGLTNCKPCFQNTHNKYSTPKEKEITYRILFNFTPIRPTLKHCPFCKTKQLGEEHLFTKCNALNTIKISLQDTLEQLTGKEINIHKSIMLNIFPRTHKTTHQLIAHLLGTYRSVIWNCYHIAQHLHNRLPPEQISLIWENKQNHIIQQHIE